jgi:predicted nucleic acid-binding protein
MSARERFFDTNVLLYMLSADESKAGRAEEELGVGGIISVQVLNEFASVASRKLKMSLEEIREFLTAIRAVCNVVPINEETHDKGLEVAEKYGLSVYDAMIVASALLSGCNTVLSEDMQDGQILEGKLKIRNPFC